MSGISAIAPNGLPGVLLESIGWTLLHSLWQGAAVAMGCAVALAVLRRSSPNARYGVGCLGLAVLVVLPVVTSGWLASIPAKNEGVPPAARGPLPPGTRFAPPTDPIGLSTRNPFRSLAEQAPDSRVGREAIRIGHRLEVWLPWIVRAWGLGVLLLSLRLLGGWMAMRRWVAKFTRPFSGLWEVRVDRLRSALGIRRRVRVLETLRETVPCVLGLWRPVILVPASALTGLSPVQLEALLAHELAHIRRHDSLVNLLQSLAETLLFYHPAVWWISHRIRVEREHCCDDLAVRVSGDAMTYARTLADLEETRGALSPVAVAATDGPLLARIRRILIPGTPQPAGSLLGVAGMIALGCLTLFAFGAHVSSRANPADPMPGPGTGGPATVDATSSGAALEHPRRAPFPSGEDVDDIPAQDLLAGGDPMKRFALIGPDSRTPAPADGYRLLLVLPGGDGGPDFHPFVKRIRKHAVPESYLVAQLVAPVWSADQFDTLVWPTRVRPWPGMRFSTEEFLEDVVREVRRHYPLDSRFVFALGWSSSGPAVYAASLQRAKAVTGSFIAMSVFKPDQLPPLLNAAGHAYFLLYSPEDFIPTSMPEQARDLLRTNGAQVETLQYPGGHGWHGEVYGNIRTGIEWLESTRNPFREAHPAEHQP